SLPDVTFTPDALAWLQQQAFPGNIRQLSNVVERSILMHGGSGQVNIEQVEKMLTNESSSNNEVVLPDVGKVSLDELERKMILKTLAFHQNSISKSARSLGITRSALYRRLEKYNIPHEGHS
ncbi:MAG: sigma-54-dependent Fis family transcriptional regulator, partial [Bacteroidetes bacterium]